MGTYYPVLNCLFKLSTAATHQGFLLSAWWVDMHVLPPRRSTAMTAPQSNLWTVYRSHPTHTCMHACTHTLACMHAHTHTCVHAHTHTHSSHTYKASKSTTSVRWSPIPGLTPHSDTVTCMWPICYGITFCPVHRPVMQSGFWLHMPVWSIPLEPAQTILTAL